jgi:hypothetical protein
MLSSSIAIFTSSNEPFQLLQFRIRGGANLSVAQARLVGGIRPPN